MNIKLMNKIAKVGTAVFDGRYTVGEDVAVPDAIMVRSAKLHEMPLNPELLAIARAGAGVNNIPVEKCAEAGVVVFNTPGANANAVKELAVCALLLASRGIVDGINWAKAVEDRANITKEVEAGKGAFAGCEIAGKTLGVIGLGAIGGMVANAANALGMQVIGYDPFLSVTNALHLSRAVTLASGYDEIFAKCDYITLHVPATKDTKGFINKAALAAMKNGVRIINLARAELVDSDAMKAAIADGKVASYVVDFPTPELIGTERVISIPHLGASTAESEDNCAVMAAKELVDFLENGNITNSVNFPTVTVPKSGGARICLAHKNIPAVLSQITTLLAKEGINIENLGNGSKGEYAYTIVDTNCAISDATTDALRAVDGMIRVRVIG
ncbi:MAG: 3-phosphoglycerate dehydrogenase [Oscillospiraceae bacterium]|nr:MAG: 3-phosphoglycerate dehydrogenase [Oscillospiraceae bacterium]